ncbi:unnamed protein product [Leptidea sinapis]|uniref:Hormone-sensitive lipase n=1 Tax=Leptidea sinapis TaxID=189913 RepID=A0A5E4Q0V0_9NEOP|nr:unnamed protein product [Leptidea sinapis]
MSLRIVNRGLQLIVRGYKNMAFPDSPAKASLCCEEVEGTPPTQAMYEALKESCQNNASYFHSDDSENGQRLYQGFVTLIDHVNTVWPLVDHVRKVAPFYDFDAKSPGNGYRSFVSVVDSCVLHGLKLSRQICTGRDTLLFRKGYFVKEVESCGQLLASLGTCITHLHTLLSWAPTGELFPTENHTPEELFSKADTINQYCFYGRCLGFQFQPSIRGILKGISICMAGFSEAYYSHGNLISSMWTGGQYLIDPELRARRIVNISQSASVEFCKAFWFLTESEIMRRVPSLMSATVAVNKLMILQPEPVVVTTLDGRETTVLPPTVHIGLHDLGARLISVNKRSGMVGETSTLPPAEGVIFHCHGGGFVAQSSKSHEGYLRDWATKLNMPILSIDYSLAPKAPFPRALEEIFYAYCWLLNHFSEVGTTGKRIVFAGDSAGANLLASCMLKILKANIRRPDGIFLAYAPLLVSFIPSPSRLLCLMDPLLPFGFMMRCLKDNKGKEAKKPNKELTTSNVTTPMDGNGFLKVSASQEGISEGVSSYEEVSPSDMTELQAHKCEPNGGQVATVRIRLSRPLRVRQRHGLGGSPVPRRDSDVETVSTLVAEPALISEAATGIMDAMTSRFASITDSNSIPGVELAQDALAVGSNLDALIARSPSDDFIFSVPREPLLSPYWADDELLKNFPPVRLLSVHLDPCLDDCN